MDKRGCCEMNTNTLSIIKVDENQYDIVVRFINVETIEKDNDNGTENLLDKWLGQNNIITGNVEIWTHKKKRKLFIVFNQDENEDEKI
jgi:hypothetical protein